ncbi:hypothetical protein [Parasediminibacterium sp. JCM 36343]|uniref:hypothetical protein n=1 Tax=Parasediminibacterium sp. JCM 36343 TaxID=3374279 RepID=UPI00397BF509
MDILPKMLLFSSFMLLMCHANASRLGKDTSGKFSLDTLGSLNAKQAALLSNKYDALSNQLDKQTSKVLGRMEKQEEKLRKKLAQKDSTRASQVFGNTKQKYASLRQKLSKPFSKLQRLNEYVPRLDSIQTATKFLSTTKPPGGQVPDANLQGANQLNASATALEGKLQMAGEVKNFIKQRESQLKQQLAGYNMGKEMLGMNKQVYYYQQQVNEYKETLKDMDKLEAKALTAVRGMPAFQSFMAKNSQLASLFRVPDNYGTPQALAGLQTRASIQQLLQSKLGAAGGPSANYFSQQVQAAKQQMGQLKDKVNSACGSSSDMAMPDFKPNSQKTKSFLKRLEYGCNIQSQRPNGLLPVSSDIALTVGYKLNDNATAGIGASYKLGWGNSMKEIRLSNQGMGLRSYLDIHLKKSIWATGGYEENYLPELSTKLSAFHIPSIGWQPSGLVGLTKKYKVGKRENNIQLLWDFLSYSQIPKGQPFKFRVGFKLEQ